jgi:hypothetical protein
MPRKKGNHSATNPTALRAVIAVWDNEIEGAAQRLSGLQREVAEFQQRLAGLQNAREFAVISLKNLGDPTSETRGAPKAESTKRSQAQAKAADAEPRRSSSTRGPFSTKGTAASDARPIDHRRLSESVARELAPEFTSRAFRDLCTAKYPGRENEFTRMKVKKRLDRMAGFEDAVISVVQAGRGRRPTTYRVNSTI